MNGEGSQGAGLMPQKSSNVRLMLAAAPTPAGWLEVWFALSGDRFRHQLVHRTDEGEHALVDSVDDGALSDWPPSPPIQQLDDCLLGQGERGLVAVGLAGTSHWSLAIESKGTELWFDVACRISSQPGPLRSTYRRSEASERLDWRPLRDGCAYQESGNELWFEPSELPLTFPGTARWRYGFAMNSAVSAD